MIQNRFLSFSERLVVSSYDYDKARSLLIEKKFIEPELRTQKMPKSSGAGEVTLLDVKDEFAKDAVQLLKNNDIYVSQWNDF